ncbi:hypothetical protein PR048_009379 [Dryococelus australis]|uniref:Uncharacterized protein n=1 Tax=Dryococelus australis TaxID=614101 RepID=A0ABQ9HZR1_9NEOP|nr:hypothetical protein PR048_009379 [Dryococelus australis]
MYELQPLDRSDFKPLESYWTSSKDVYVKKLKRTIIRSEFGKIFTSVRNRAVTKECNLKDLKQHVFTHIIRIGLPINHMRQHNKNSVIKPNRTRMKRVSQARSNSKARANKALLDKVNTETGNSRLQNFQNKSQNWYCHLCKTDRQLDMRFCNQCLRYEHEECEGLTGQDKMPQFVCSYFQDSD